MAHSGERVSLALQFVASFCWALGAGLGGPSDAADILQFLAAVAWCFANAASAWAMMSTGTLPPPNPKVEMTGGGARGGGAQNV